MMPADRINNIIEKRLFGAAQSVKSTFPKSISEGSGFFVSFGNDRLHAVFFLDAAHKKEVEDRIARRIDPFPGLISIDEKSGAAFRFENSKNCIVERSQVKNSYAFSLGKNCSIVLVDFLHEINVTDLGLIRNVIDLGFIITFPDDDPTFDIGDSLDDLISYYISTRR